MKKKIILLLFLTIFLTGCRTTFKHEEKVYTENIVCRPTKEENIKIYKENEIDIENLQECENIKLIAEDYEGPWNAIFVNPLSFLLIKVGGFLNSYGFSIIMITLLLRIIVMPITAKTAKQSENMKKAKPELTALELKYKDKNDQASTMAKGQEQLLIYKKYDIKPLSGCLFALIQIPLFLAFFEALNRVPVLFEENFLGLFELKLSPLEGINIGHYYYIIIPILVILTTFYSFKLNKTASVSPEQEKQMKLTTNIMVVFISFMSFNLSLGIALYWIFNSSFTIIQNLFFKKKKEV